MSANGIQNLPELLEQAGDGYRNPVTLSPVSTQTLRRRAEHFASGARFGLRSRLRCSACMTRPKIFAAFHA